jgi:hypothetical protein
LIHKLREEKEPFIDNKQREEKSYLLINKEKDVSNFQKRISYRYKYSRDDSYAELVLMGLTTKLKHLLIQIK